MNRHLAQFRQAVTRFTVEQLDDRLVPAAIFAVGGSDGSVDIVSAATGIPIVSNFRPLDVGTQQYTGLVEVAVGDLNKDGTPDLFIAAANPVGVAELDVSKAGKVFVYDGAMLQGGNTSLSPFHVFTPFATTDGPNGTTGAFINGLNIAVADVNGNGTVDLIAGTRGGSATDGNPEYGRLAVISSGAAADGSSDAVIGSILTPFGATYQKGVVVTGGDYNGDHKFEVAVTRGGPVASTNPNKSVKLKVFTFAGGNLTELNLTGTGAAFAPFGSITNGSGGVIDRDARLTSLDSDGDGIQELVFTAVDRITDPANPRIRVGVYVVNTNTGFATLVSTGVNSDPTIYLLGNQIVDHAISHVDLGGGISNLAVLTQSGTSFGIQYFDPITGDVKPGGFLLSLLSGGLTIDGI